MKAGELTEWMYKTYPYRHDDALRDKAESRRWVYVVYSFDNKAYKIGSTKDLRHRFSAIKTYHPGKLTFVAGLLCMPLDKRHVDSVQTYYCTHAGLIEKRLHKYFNHKKNKREWFNLNGSDIREIIDYFQEEDSYTAEQEPLIPLMWGDAKDKELADRWLFHQIGYTKKERAEVNEFLERRLLL